MGVRLLQLQAAAGNTAVAQLVRAQRAEAGWRDAKKHRKYWNAAKRTVVDRFPLPLASGVTRGRAPS